MAGVSLRLLHSGFNPRAHRYSFRLVQQLHVHALASHQSHRTQSYPAPIGVVEGAPLAADMLLAFQSGGQEVTRDLDD